MQAILALLFAAVFLRFVDDLHGLDYSTPGDEDWPLAGPAGASGVARSVVTDLLGWQLDSCKSIQDSLRAEILGVDVHVDVETASLVFEVPDEKRSKWRTEVEGILARNYLTPSSATKLAGRLSWGSSAVYGRACRVHLAPLYQHARGASSRVSGRLRRSLQWWVSFLQTNPSHVAPLKCHPVLCSSCTRMLQGMACRPLWSTLPVSRFGRLA